MKADARDPKFIVWFAALWIAVAAVMVGIVMFVDHFTPDPKPPFIVTSVSEGDGCCDIHYRDFNWQAGFSCTSFGNMTKYKQGDTLKSIPK